jgi:hypothetical protein
MAGIHSARLARGWRVLYEIDDAKHAVIVLDIRHRPAAQRRLQLFTRTSGRNSPMPRMVILVGAALAAGLTMTACGSGGGSAASGGSPAASAGPGAASSPSTSCLLQYRLWNTGPAHAAGENLVAALNTLEAATSTSDIPTTAAALKRAGTAARKLEHYPIPVCADPKGYWHADLARIRAAADNAGTSGGQGALTLAEVTLKQMPTLERKLAAELKGTVPGLSQNQ